MSHQTRAATLIGGMQLVQHYDSALNPDVQVGDVAYWQTLEGDTNTGPLAYYEDAAGVSKFTSKIELHVYSPLLKGTPDWPADFGGADCLDLSHEGKPYCSRIRIQYFDPRPPENGGFGPYKLAGAYSHEVGHAFHNWTKLFSHPGFGPVFKDFWGRRFALNGTPENGAVAPWDQPWGPGTRDETVWEQMANACRHAFGALLTRGVSGDENGGTDKPVAGFADPDAHPEWARMLTLTPELTAYLERYGLNGPSLSWQTDQATGHSWWQFLDGRGKWVAQTSHVWSEGWWEWTGTGWVRFWPQYSRA